MNEIIETATTKTNKQCDRISAARILLKLMKIMGLWQWKSYANIDAQRKKYEGTYEKEFQGYPILEWMQKLSVHVPFSFLYITLMWVEVVTSNNLEQASDVLYMSLTEAALIVKILNIWRYSDKAWNYITELMYSKSYELLYSDEIEYWQRKQNQFRLIIVVFVSGSVLTVVAAAVGVLFSTEYQLPFAYWVPFEWRTNERNYWIAYLYNILGISVTAIANVCLDMMGCYMMFHMGLLYKVLGFRLTRLNAVKSDDVVKEFGKIFRFHSNLKRLTKDCERLVSSYVLSQIILSALILCFCGYRIQKMNILQNPGQFFSMLQFLCVMILEIYLPCYFANEITLNSSQLCSQIYNSEWLTFSLKTRKLMNLYMEFLKHPEKIKAGNYFDVGLPIFTRVINNAYSVFALLMNVEK